MDEMQQITLEQWMTWKEDIREKLRETAGNFVYIGFRLKQIRDSEMLDGAADIFEFAQKEYGLSKSTTSRFIAINEKFSEGGNSIELRQEFRAIGSSKLAEMLTLTDAECQMITERTTVKDIRELKNFSKQDVPEGESEVVELPPLEKCIVDYFKDKKEMLNKVVKAVYEDDFRTAAELMNPSGYATHKKGLCFMFMYDMNTGVKIKLLTQPQPISMTWRELLLSVYSLYSSIYESGENDVYKSYYGEPEKEVKIEEKKVKETQQNQGVEDSVATSQQEEKTEEKDVQIVEKVEEETVPEEESGEGTEQDPDDELSAEPEDDEDGAGETGPSGEFKEDDCEEELSSAINPPVREEKRTDALLDRRIKEVQRAVIESLEYIKERVEDEEPNSIMITRAQQSIHELETHLNNLYELVVAKEEEDE